MLLTRHDLGCPPANRTGLGGHHDAAHRIADTYELHRAAAGWDVAAGRWFASALADGSTDGVLYDTKRDAARHQHGNELRYLYVCIGIGPMSVCSADSLIRTRRSFADRGIPQADPDHRAGGADPVRRLTIADQRSLVASIITGGAAANLLYRRN